MYPATQYMSWNICIGIDFSNQTLKRKAFSSRKIFSDITKTRSENNKGDSYSFY